MNSTKGLIMASLLLLNQEAQSEQDYCNEIPQLNIFAGEVSEIIQCEENSDVNIYNKRNIRKFEKSKKIVGEIEINNFCNFFRLENCDNPDEFVGKVKELQKRFGISQDGELGRITLKHIYLEYYIYNQDNLNEEVLEKVTEFLKKEEVIDYLLSLTDKVESLEKLCNESPNLNKFTGESTEIIQCEENSDVNIYNKRNIRKFEKSKEIVGEIEINNFCNFFKLENCDNPDEFVAKVKELQKRFGISQDGELGRITLKHIYSEYYIYNQDNLNEGVGEQSEKVEGGEQSEKVEGGEQSKKVEGGEQSEKVEGGEQSEKVEGGEQSEKVEGGEQSEKVEGGEQSEKVEGGEQSEKVEGGEQSEKVEGGEQSEKVESLDKPCNEIPDLNRFVGEVTEIINCKENTEINSYSIENIKKFENSERLVGKIEINNFCKFFKLEDCYNPDEFVDKVKELQGNIGINTDGILGPITLYSIYLKYYIYEQDNLSYEVLKRIKIFSEMELYNNISFAYNSKLNVFDKKIFYGRNVGINISGTYINENLVDHIPRYLDNNENIIKFLKINGKTVLAFYVIGELQVATYSTPGMRTKPTPELVTKGEIKPDILHVSNSYPERRDEEGKIISRGGAVMPYAVHVDRAIWIHGSDSTIDGRPHSHGCIRVGLYYIEHIYELVNTLGIENVIIDTTGIY